MSQSTVKKSHKIQVRNRPGNESKITSGASTEVLLDGEPMKYVTFFKFEVRAKKLAKVVIEMYAEVEIDAEVELDLSTETTDLTIKGKPVALHTLSSLYPAAIALKKTQ